MFSPYLRGFHLDPGALPPLKDAGPGYAALGSSGYAVDT